jgi:regulator of replication initiation timing
LPIFILSIHFRQILFFIITKDIQSNNNNNIVLSMLYAEICPKVRRHKVKKDCKRRKRNHNNNQTNTAILLPIIFHICSVMFIRMKECFFWFTLLFETELFEDNFRMIKLASCYGRSLKCIKDGVKTQLIIINYYKYTFVPKQSDICFRII